MGGPASATSANTAEGAIGALLYLGCSRDGEGSFARLGLSRIITRSGMSPCSTARRSVVEIHRTRVRRRRRSVVSEGVWRWDRNEDEVLVTNCCAQILDTRTPIGERGRTSYPQTECLSAITSAHGSPNLPSPTNPTCMSRMSSAATGIGRSDQSTGTRGSAEPSENLGDSILRGWCNKDRRGTHRRYVSPRSGWFMSEGPSSVPHCGDPGGLENSFRRPPETLRHWVRRDDRRRIPSRSQRRRVREH